MLAVVAETGPRAITRAQMVWVVLVAVETPWTMLMVRLVPPTLVVVVVVVIILVMLVALAVQVLLFLDMRLKEISWQDLQELKTG